MQGACMQSVALAVSANRYCFEIAYCKYRLCGGRMCRDIGRYGNSWIVIV